MKQKKHIGFVIHHIENKGGEERMCTLIASYLVDHGYDVTIISLWTEKGKKAFYPIHQEVKMRYIMDTKLIVRLNNLLPWMNFYRRKLRYVIKNTHIDVLIDVDTMCTPDTSVALYGLFVKHIAWDHFCYSNFERKHMERLPYLQKKIDRLVVLTKDDLHDYVNKAKLEPSKVCHIYNPSPIELSEYLPHYKKKVLAIGRLEEQKRFDRLLNIWSMVEKENNEWELEIVGDGSKETTLKEQAKILGLKRVKFSPSTSTPMEKYKDASIFVLTSQYEGFVLVMLEALNASLPVISFDCDNGPREVVKDGMNGFLIEQGNEVKFKESLLNIMNDDFLREKISNNCLDSVHKFKMEFIGKQWVSLIEQI